jgi:hypothetical protein
MTKTTTNRPVQSDPMMVMLRAIHARTQIALGELAELADAQKDNNEKLGKVRAAEQCLREMIATNGDITREELRELEQKCSAEVGIDISSFTKSMWDEMDALKRSAEAGDAANGDGSRLWYSEHSTEGWMKDRQEAVKNIRESLNSLKDAIKGEGSARELDMQKVTQEVSTGMQAESNISKRWNDVGNAIIGNYRA